MINCINCVQDGNARLKRAISIYLASNDTQLTGTRIIQPVVASVPLIHITHTSIPKAPRSEQIRRKS